MISGSASMSDSTSRGIVDFMDMNGDRFPDIILTKGRKFTFSHPPLTPPRRGIRGVAWAKIPLLGGVRGG